MRSIAEENGLVILSAGVPIPAEHEAKGAVVERAIEAALREAEASGVSGSAVRPYTGVCYPEVVACCPVFRPEFLHVHDSHYLSYSMHGSMSSLVCKPWSSEVQP